MFDLEEFKVVPAKSVKGIIEIKSTLTKQKLLEFLSTSTLPCFGEVPPASKMYLLSTVSRISARKAFEVTKSFYDKKPDINKFLSAIYSMDWSGMIVSNDYWKGKEITVKIGRINIDRELGLAPFLGTLVKDLYGIDALESIVNNLGPSLFKLAEDFSVTLYTK